MVTAKTTIRIFHTNAHRKGKQNIIKFNMEHNDNGTVFTFSDTIIYFILIT